MKHSLLIAGLTSTVLLISGCSSFSNPFASKPDPRTVPAQLVTIDKPGVMPRLQWQQNVGNAGAYAFTPALIEDSVYAAGTDGNVARFDQGRQVWRVQVGQPLSGGVGSDGKVVAVGTAKGEVIALNADNGKPLWKARVSSEVLAAPAVGQDMVIVRSGDSQITAFDPADGKRRWVYQRSMPTLNLRSAVGVVLAPGGVLAGFPGGKLVVIAIANGSEIWEATVAQPKGATELERVADITSPPVISGRQVCAAAFQGRVACFDLASGNGIWAREFSSISGLDIDSKAVYISGDNGTVQALDKSSGASLWKQDKLLNRGLSRPLVVGGIVAVGDFQGYIHFLRVDDGGFSGRIATDGSGISADPQRTSDGFLIQTHGGSLNAYHLE